MSVRITVEDLLTGDKECMEITAGDYMLIPVEPCYIDGIQAYPASGTHVITIKGHRPAGKPRKVPTEAVTADADRP